MSIENNSSLSFTKIERERFTMKLQEIEIELKPYCHNLTLAERRQMLKMRDKSTVFVGKSIQYAKEFPSVIPPLLDIEMMERNFVQAQEMDHLVRKAEKLLECINDARMISANQAAITSLKVYHALRGAEDLDVPGIKSALEELGKRFTRKGKKSVSDPFPETSNEEVQKPVTRTVMNGNAVDADLHQRNN